MYVCMYVCMYIYHVNMYICVCCMYIYACIIGWDEVPNKSAGMHIEVMKWSGYKSSHWINDRATLTHTWFLRMCIEPAPFACDDTTQFSSHSFPMNTLMTFSNLGPLDLFGESSLVGSLMNHIPKSLARDSLFIGLVTLAIYRLYIREYPHRKPWCSNGLTS